jgi:hypothetical protein
VGNFLNDIEGNIEDAIENKDGYPRVMPMLCASFTLKICLSDMVGEERSEEAPDARRLHSFGSCNSGDCSIWITFGLSGCAAFQAQYPALEGGELQVRG